MIAAVKVESNALFSVKEKLQEMDSLRDQLVAVNKRMVEQEQTNLNLKQNLIANQQAISELRKQKTEVSPLVHLTNVHVLSLFLRRIRSL